MGEWAELDKLEIFFADPGALNDPLEGFKDIVWEGDAIAWRNHLRHYLLGLMQTLSVSLIMGPDYDAVAEHDFSGLTADRLPTPQLRVLFDTISDRFFSDGRVQTYPEELARRGAIRRDEFLFYLWTLHGRALHTVFEAFEQAGLLPPRLSRPDASDWGSDPLDHDYFVTLAAAVAQTPGGDPAAEFFIATTSVMEQDRILKAEARSRMSTGWAGLVLDFPARYLDRLQRLMHPPWYVACFADNCQHPAMWGNYGDSHKGVCLEYRPDCTPDGTMTLPIRRPVGWSGGEAGPEPIVETTAERLHPVRYTSERSATDFFSSLGRITRSDVAFWFTGPDGASSISGEALREESDAWRQAYWSHHFTSLTTKLTGWRHEGEHRIILTSVLNDFETQDSRKLTCPFERLSGIVFGIRTPVKAKAEIVRIIREKCASTGRTSFDFYQAYYARETGCIERVKLTLLSAGET